MATVTPLRGDPVEVTNIEGSIADQPRVQRALDPGVVVTAVPRFEYGEALLLDPSGL